MRSVLLLSMVSLFLTGCGGGGYDGPKLHSVTGKLTKGGAPVGGVNISLVPPQGAGADVPALVALTKDDGTFTIMTSSGHKGAPIGMYKVVIIAPPPEFDYKTAKGPPKQTSGVIPSKYSAASSTDKTFEVKAVSNVLDLDL
jgi:hypothetical protein